MSTQRNITILILIISLGIGISGCSVLQQTSEMKNFGKCEFRLESVDNMKLAGVVIQETGSMAELGILEYARISSAIAKGSLPLTFDLVIAAKNPNKGTAAMNRLEWILFIDKVEMTRGVLSNRIEIPAQNITTFPVSMNIDLVGSLSGESGDALLNFAFNLAGSGDKPSHIMLRAKPTILIGGSPVEYPGYISIRQTFGAE